MRIWKIPYREETSQRYLVCNSTKATPKIIAVPDLWRFACIAPFRVERTRTKHSQSYTNHTNSGLVELSATRSRRGTCETETRHSSIRLDSISLVLPVPFAIGSQSLCGGIERRCMVRPCRVICKGGRRARARNSDELYHM